MTTELPTIACPSCLHRQYDRSHPAWAAICNHGPTPGTREALWRCTACWGWVKGEWADDYRWDTPMVCESDVNPLAG